MKSPRCRPRWVNGRLPARFGNLLGFVVSARLTDKAAAPLLGHRSHARSLRVGTPGWASAGRQPDEIVAVPAGPAFVCPGVEVAMSMPPDLDRRVSQGVRVRGYPHVELSPPIRWEYYVSLGSDSRTIEARTKLSGRSGRLRPIYLVFERQSRTKESRDLPHVRGTVNLYVVHRHPVRLLPHFLTIVKLHIIDHAVIDGLGNPGWLT